MERSQKYKKILLCIVCILVICWLAMFTTDFIRSSALKNPVFAQTRATADDGGSGTYQGLGYKIEVKMSVGVEYGRRTDCVKIYIFGREIAAFYHKI